MERIAGDMSGYEPEVALAVRVAPSGDAEPEKDSDDGEEEDDGEAEIDEFLSSNGFEFIDASDEMPAAEGSGPFSQGAFQLEFTHFHPAFLSIIKNLTHHCFRYSGPSACARRPKHHNVAINAG